MTQLAPITADSITTLVFGSGGLRGAPMIAAALWRLDQRLPDMDFTSKRRSIREIRATSIGCLAAIYIACRVPPESFLRDVLTIDYAPLVDFSIMDLTTDFGLNNGEKVRLYLDNLIHSKTSLQQATFEELQKWSGIDLKFVAVDLNHCSSEEFIMSSTTTPTMSVAKAALASMGIPVFFAPVKYDAHLLVDGALVNGFPVRGLAGKACDPATTLGFSISGQWFTPSSSVKAPFWGYLEKLLTVILKLQDKHRKDNCVHVITLHAPPGISALTWDISHEQRRVLMQDSFEKVDDFIKAGFIYNKRPKTDSATQTGPSP
jgi:predicted acylesterase/phospholipase RssA